MLERRVQLILYRQLVTCFLVVRRRGRRLRRGLRGRGSRRSLDGRQLLSRPRRGLRDRRNRRRRLGFGRGRRIAFLPRHLLGLRRGLDERDVVLGDENHVGGIEKRRRWARRGWWRILGPFRRGDRCSWRGVRGRCCGDRCGRRRIHGPFGCGNRRRGGGCMCRGVRCGFGARGAVSDRRRRSAALCRLRHRLRRLGRPQRRRLGRPRRRRLRSCALAFTRGRLGQECPGRGAAELGTEEANCRA
jgi:hypothetical protein